MKRGPYLPVIAACVVAWLAACGGPVLPTTAPTPRLDVTGILLVDAADAVQAGPVTRDVADAWQTALMMVEANGDDVGYPWIDPVTGELLLSAATPRGRTLIESAGIGVPYRIRQVAYAATELRRIQDDVTFLRARGVTDAQLITATIPDHRDNRALVVMSALSRPLLDDLAARYPADAIAVQIDPDSIGGGPG